jgi:sialate O-acetylesterase
MQLKFKSLSIFILGIICVEGYSQLKTPLIIQSGMVIQRNHEIPLWGEGVSNKLLRAKLNGAADSTTISTDVYVGDVWIASGQSNMQMELKNSDPPDSEIDPNDNEEIRQFMVNRSLKNTAAKDVPTGSKWTPATSVNTGNFTAIGFYFSKYLYAHLDIPIGIINASYGGTRIELDEQWYAWI